LQRKTLGIVFIYTAAVCILLSILFLFGLIPFRLPYTIAASGFLLYVVGIFLSREGKFSVYKVAMIVLALLLIILAVTREIIKR
jgi:hypothetical protein